MIVTTTSDNYKKYVELSTRRNIIVKSLLCNEKISKQDLIELRKLSDELGNMIKDAADYKMKNDLVTFTT